jgi:hypothetical protein
VIRRFLSLLLLCGLLTVPRAHGQTAAAGEAEGNRCLDRLESVRRDVLGKYEDQLGELQAQFQKAADLEGALATRAEIQRVHTAHTLADVDFVTEPKALRALQQQSLSKIEELCASVVSETIPRLVELKKALTVAGQLDDAVKVRTWIEKLQNEHVPLTRPAAGELVTADALVTAYAANRARADQAYKDARIVVRGTLVTYRIDTSDARRATVYLGKVGGTGWIACAFENGLRFREDKAFNGATLVLINANNGIVGRWQSGQTVEIAGTCDGFEDVVRLSKCELPH